MGIDLEKNLIDTLLKASYSPGSYIHNKIKSARYMMETGWDPDTNTRIDPLLPNYMIANGHAVGLFIPDQHVIQIAQGQSRKQTDLTFFHEQKHAQSWIDELYTEMEARKEMDYN